MKLKFKDLKFNLSPHFNVNFTNFAESAVTHCLIIHPCTSRPHAAMLITFIVIFMLLHFKYGECKSVPHEQNEHL